MSTKAKRAMTRVKDALREGGKLMKMHSVHGRKWYLLTARASRMRGGEVAEEIAALVIREPDVFPSRDGMFPGCDQTYRMGQP